MNNKKLDANTFMKNVSGRTVRLLRGRGIWASAGKISDRAVEIVVPRDFGTWRYVNTFDSAAIVNGATWCATTVFNKVIITETDAAIRGMRDDVPARATLVGVSCACGVSVKSEQCELDE